MASVIKKKNKFANIDFFFSRVETTAVAVDSYRKNPFLEKKAIQKRQLRHECRQRAEEGREDESFFLSFFLSFFHKKG